MIPFKSTSFWKNKAQDSLHKIKCVVRRAVEIRESASDGKVGGELEEVECLGRRGAGVHPAQHFYVSISHTAAESH